MPQFEQDPLAFLWDNKFKDQAENKKVVTDEIKTPEQLAKAIVDHPNEWGMYSIADAIHKLINQRELV